MRAPHRHGSQSGFSLIELLVAIVVGMVIVAALSLLFANNSRARQEMEKTSQQIENGRYATQYIRDDLRLAGYWGQLTPSGLTAPTTLPDPSLTGDSDVMTAMPLAVQGYHFGMSSSASSTIPTGVSSLLTDRKANTDVIVIRRASTCYAGPSSAETNCSTQDVTTSKYFQSTLCQSQIEALSSANQMVISATAAVFNSSNPNITTAPTFLAQKNCTDPAVTRAVYVHIYYIANNDTSGDGIPTLKMVSLGSTAFNSPIAIAEGIETMQVEWGIDDGTNGGTKGDGVPDEWKNDPTTGIAAPADQVTAWTQVTAAKLHIIARNTQNSPNQFTDTRTYVLGSVASTDNTFGPYNDSYKRHAYTTAVRLVNVAGRFGQ